MIDNPFAVIERRFNRLESLLLELKEEKNNTTVSLEAPEPFISKQEAAHFIKCSLPSLTKRVAEGKIPIHRMGRKVYFLKSELVKAMESPFKRA